MIGRTCPQIRRGGAWETYLVDENGVIRYRHSGLWIKKLAATVFCQKLSTLKNKMKSLLDISSSKNICFFCNRTFIRIFTHSQSGNGGYLSIQNQDDRTRAVKVSLYALPTMSKTKIWWNLILNCLWLASWSVQMVDERAKAINQLSIKWRLDLVIFMNYKPPFKWRLSVIIVVLPVALF